MGKLKNSSSQWEELLSLPDWRLKQFGRWLTKGLFNATKHLPDKEGLIFKVFKNSVLLLFLMKRSQTFKRKIIFMLGSLPESKWTTFLDNLNTSSDPNTLAMQLLKISGRELISRDKAFQLFWNPVYKEISEKLLLPTGTDFVGLDTNSSSKWLSKQEEESKFLKIKSTSLRNKNLQKISWPSSMSSLASKWEDEVTQAVKLKTLVVKIYPTNNQKVLLNKYFDTFRYVYNKALACVKKHGHKPNFISLRDLLVTENTKKGYDEYSKYDEDIKKLQNQKKNTEDKVLLEHLSNKTKELNKERRDKMKTFDSVRNQNILPFELETPKDIRACAVKRCCDAYKSGFSNLRNGNIIAFNMDFKKKKDKHQTLEVSPKLISITKNGNIQLTPNFLKNDCVFKVSTSSKKKLKNLKVQTNTDIVRTRQGYYVHVLVPTKQYTCPNYEIVGSVDLGVRTLGTTHLNSLSTNDTIVVEYKHRSDLLKKYNKKLNILKIRKKHTRKKQLSKLETKKTNLVNLTHWLFINDLLSRVDVLYLGDIKSHDIVTGGKNKTLNLLFNDLKFFQLKSRLLYKASLQGKRVFLVPEHYTTKTCSKCGTINNDIGSKEVFTCPCCHLMTGRDMNASINIKMKGILS